MVLECCLWMFVAILLLGKVDRVIGCDSCVIYILSQPLGFVTIAIPIWFDRILFKWALLAKLILAVDQFRHSRA